MSRQSDAKKARRRKRQAARTTASADVRAADESDPIGEAIAGIDEWIGARGWVLDAETGADLVSWFYPPSAADVDDDDREPVTRVWITIDEDDDEVVLEFGAVLVGMTAEDEAYLLDPDTLADDIAELEGYRLGSPRPVLA